MRVTINGNEQQVADGTTMSQLLDELQLEPVRVAVEINQDLVTRSTFAETVIRDGDHIEIVTFVGGG